jgi:hypothetical protein
MPRSPQHEVQATSMLLSTRLQVSETGRAGLLELGTILSSVYSVISRRKRMMKQYFALVQFSHSTISSPLRNVKKVCSS